MKRKELTNHLMYAGLLFLMACSGESHNQEQISLPQDKSIVSRSKNEEPKLTEPKQKIPQGTNNTHSGRPIAYSGIRSADYTSTDTIDKEYRVKTIMMMSYDPDDYEGPRLFPVTDIYGNNEFYDLYYYGSRGKIILSNTADTSYSDSVYITRDLIAEKLGLKENPDVNIKRFGLGDQFTYKEIRNDSIIIETILGVYDSGELFDIALKFKIGDKAENFDVQEITNKWTWEDD